MAKKVNKKNTRGGKRKGAGAHKKENAKTKNAQVRCTPEAHANIQERIKIYAEEEEKRVLELKRKGIEL